MKMPSILRVAAISTTVLMDWYGNSRPIFIRNRVFALMGYEIVEGAIADNAITELKRITFSPMTGGLAR